MQDGSLWLDSVFATKEQLPAVLCTLKDELTNTAAVVIAIITICATLSVVAGLEFGIKTVSYAALMCGNVLMMVVFALDEPWYILNVIVQTVGYHLNLGVP